MSRRGRRAAQAPRKRISDNEWSTTIVEDLRRNSGLVVDELLARNFTKHYIESVREHIRYYLAEPQPSEVIKKIELLAGHARALASGMSALSDNLYYKLSFSFIETEFVPRKPQWTQEQQSKTQRWIADLEKIANSLEEMKKAGRRYFRYEPEVSCAFSAAQLIDALSPTAELTTGETSQFYRIAELLWEAASGCPKSMKRPCDLLLSACRGDEKRIKGEYLLTEFLRSEKLLGTKASAIAKG